MSSEQLDWLSAASDNQGISAQQLDQLISEPELQDQWLRFQMAGAAIRDELPPALDLDFADRFASLLDKEEAHVLQVEAVPVLAVASANNASANIFKSAANSGWFKNLMQGAIAAGVAIIAVVGVQNQQNNADDALTSPLPVLQTGPMGNVVAPVSLSQTTVQTQYNPQQQQLMLEQQRRLQELMQARQQQIRLMEQAAIEREKAAKAEQEPKSGGQ
ncbi:MAG: anti-anti-sigma factor [Gammaproteobacteria bacterium]|jgi:sigma-E factor negative regulatory protein RseA|nr:anti-anti-sigma factor [Gammaproteobacteria bacterium]